MATFLDTQGINHYLNQLINNAETELLLVSPYLQINNLLRKRLELKSKSSINFRLIYRTDENISKNEIDWISGIDNLELLVLEELHAKCYLSEKEAIVGSMNLYKYSQTNNFEMGIHVTKEADPELYGKIRKEVESFISYGVRSKYMKKQIEISMGFCIRTGKQIPFNIERPMCDKAFVSWQRYKDIDYIERYCHFTGEESNGATSFSKPILKKNWKAAQVKYKF